MKRILTVAVAAFLTITSAVAQQKIGHVKTQDLLDTMPSRKIALAQLEEFQTKGMQELKEMNDAFEKAYMIYEQKKNTYSPTIQQIEEKKLMKSQQDLQDRDQQLQQELAAISQELNAPIQERVKKAVKIVADRKKLSYVVDKDSMLYSDGGIDITAEVIVELLKLDAEASKAATTVAPK